MTSITTFTTCCWSLQNIKLRSSFSRCNRSPITFRTSFCIPVNERSIRGIESIDRSLLKNTIPARKVRKAIASSAAGEALSDVTETPVKNKSSSDQPEVINNVWKWRGWSVHYSECSAVTDDTKTLVLIHGFGASHQHWRNNIRELGKQYRVFSVDLLGFGFSDKPLVGTLDTTGSPVAYNFDYWAAEVIDFVKEVVKADGEKVTLVGNSIGCSVSMEVALLEPSIVDRMVIISPSLRMLNVRKRSWAQNITAPALMRFFKYKLVGTYFFNQLSRPNVLRRILYSAYAVKEAVDEELIEMIREPALTPGALDVFLAFISYDEGPIPEDQLPLLKVPVMMLHGVLDSFEPFKLAEKYREYDAVKRFVPLTGVGHCGMDEAPEVVNKLIDEFVSSQEELMKLSAQS